MLADRQTACRGVKLLVKWYNLGNNVNRHVANMEKGFLMSQVKMEDIISLCKRRGFICNTRVCWEMSLIFERT